MTDQTLMVSTPMMTTTICPLCRFPLAWAGRLVAFCDHAGQSFTFTICPRCSGRLDRLPGRQQGRQMDIAIANLAKHPDRYRFRAFDSEIEARLFVKLESERLRKVN